MNGPDERAIERPCRVSEPLPHLGVGLLFAALLQFMPDPQLHVAGGRMCKRDGDNLTDVRARRDHLDDPLDQRRSLARSRRSLHDPALVQTHRRRAHAALNLTGNSATPSTLSIPAATSPRLAALHTDRTPAGSRTLCTRPCAGRPGG